MTVEARIGNPQILSDDWPKLHLTKDVALKINARCDFDQDGPFRPKLENCPLSDEVDLLAGAPRELAAKGDLRYLLDELLFAAFSSDGHSAAGEIDF